MKYYFQVLFLLTSILFGNSYAQELPPIKSFTPKMYDADNQNWAISQSQDKLIYVANNKGLLEYNGSNWNLYSTPNQTVTRAVHVVEDKIYTGCYMEFGYWQKDVFGTLNYFSLSEKYNNLVEDEEFWKIINIKQWVLFQSLDRIYIYDTINDTFNIIEPESAIKKLYLVDEEVYFQVFNKGLFKIENGLAIQLINDSRINNSRVVNMFKHETGLLILTDKKGFFHFDNSELKIWSTTADNKLKGMTIYSAQKLNDSSIIIGTISNGIITLDPNGNIIYHINQSSGLQNNTILSIFQDIDENIWLGLDNGINFINSYSPFKIYYDFSGSLGTIYTSVIYKENIYLGTNQGLFYKSISSNGVFNLVNGTNGQVWSLDKINDELFCGHDSGTFIIRDNEAIRIANIQGTWDIKPIEGKKNLLLQGNYDGLHILEKKGTNWSLRNKIIGFDISSRFFELFNKETVFVSHEYKGIYKIKLDSSYLKTIKIEKQAAFKKSHNSSLVKYQDIIYYANSKGVYRYDLSHKEFIRDSIVSQLYNKDEYISGRLIQDKTNKLWNFSKYNLSYLETGSLTNTQELITIALPDIQVNNINGFENITHLFDEQYLIGTSNGYMIMDLSQLKFNKYSISMSKIEAGKLELNLEKVALNAEGNFNNKTNNIHFSYNIPEYYKYSEKRYQYKLEGYNTSWSNWSTDSSHLFENLPFGNYTFKVKGRIGNKLTINTANYNFTIERPWYLSDLFMTIFVISGLFLLGTIHLFYRGYYKKQQAKILKQTQRDLNLKELENKQQLANFENEVLLQNIKSKNRELAVSTMSLIKKNEFLGNIKNELNKINLDNNLKSIIKIIDKNINNTNDWELFEEAFNNADKDFLKKVKSKHTLLTSKDLRLCAYLRLNLTSKEIAPLLNISARSVEVKRYRLRKKMSLDHDTSLTDYILEL